MQEKLDPQKLNCIEVKGMNGLSIPYIKRFFGHAGQVQEIKKANDKVIIRFKYRSSVNKARRFNGRTLDKDPIKIRNLSNSTPVEQIPGRKPPKNCHPRDQNEKISDRIKYGPLDISYHWQRLDRLLGNFQDDQLRWLIYQLFVAKLNQIYTFYLFGGNDRSKYSEYVLKQMILTHKTKQAVISHNVENSSTRKLQYSAYLPDDLQYESTYQAWNNRMENRIRHRFLSLRTEGDGLKLFYLYMLFYRNSLKLEDESRLISDNEQPIQNQKIKKVSIKKVTPKRFQICIEDWLQKFSERSEYRNIDFEHPSKEIQIFSDSCFHQGPSSAAVFQVFTDQFDGCITNSFATNIFHELKAFFAPNCILIKHTDSRKNSYQRLFFELRMLECASEVFQQKQYFMLWTPKNQSNPEIYEKLYNDNNIPPQYLQLSEKMNRISSVKMQKHNLVFGNYSNDEMILYSVEEYVDYYCGLNEEQTDSEYLRSLTVFLVCSNSNQQQFNKICDFVDKWKYRQKIMKIKAALCVLTITDPIKFQKARIRNYLQIQVDSIIKVPINIDIARMRAKQFLLENSDKFHCIEEPEKFITNTIWELYQKRGKRNARNQILEFTRKVRM